MAEQGEKKTTLGETLFPYATFETAYNFTDRAIEIFKPIWNAEVIEEIEEALFVLKLPSRNELARKNITSIALALEKVFSDLTRPNLIEIIKKWYEKRNPGVMFISITKLVSQCRERIGAMALEVFFDVVFDLNKESFWRYLSRTENVMKKLNPQKGLYLEFNPQALCVYLKYLSLCNENTRKSHKTKIRKFLQTVFKEPLILNIEGNQFKATIAHWSLDARRTLAGAIVANGMYEECLDIKEAYHPLSVKFLKGYEEVDALIHISFGGISEVEAFKLSTDPSSEWGHIAGVLIRMAIKYGYAEFTTAFDAKQTLSSIGEHGMSPRLGIVWKKSYEVNSIGVGLVPANSI